MRPNTKTNKDGIKDEMHFFFCEQTYFQKNFLAPPIILVSDTLLQMFELKREFGVFENNMVLHNGTLYHKKII